MIRRRATVLVLLLALALVAAACAGDDTGSQSDDTTTTTAGSTDTTAAETTTTTEATTTTADPAADYPEKPITWMVMFDPGGGSDVEARRVQPTLEDILGTRLQIEYRSGGGGAVGWSELVKQDADGYTAGGLVIPHIVIQPLALDDPGYQTQEIRAVAWTVGGPACLMVAKDSEYQTLEELLAFARENPGEVTVGGVATFSGSDLATAQLMNEADVELTYVPITGGAAPTIAELLGGHIDSAMISTPHCVRNAENVTAIGVAGDERFSGLPDVPTFGELGYDVTISFAWGVGVPAGTPDAIATKFGNAVIQAMTDSGADVAVIDEGLVPIMLGPDEAQAFVDEQIEIYGELLPIVQAMHE